ncbi:MAG: hypothetical protein HY854_16265 [Burkholderiales bacterium]|nr:hypothetical protein [Burkholderiales bacterium]
MPACPQSLLATLALAAWHLTLATLLALPACLVPSGPVLAGSLMGSSALRSTQAALASELARNAFGEPLVVRSQELARQAEGHAYAVLELPFPQVSAILADRAQWCELLMLHLNNKYCRTTDEEGTPRIELYVGKKQEQPVRSATRLRFVWMPAPARPDYVAVQMEAPDGPYDTRDYTLVAEAVPLDSQRTFLHFGYAFAYGRTSHFAIHLYLATIGRDKVGFSPQPGGPEGEPGYVGGMRGVVERNVMRYVLAIRSHATAATLPPGHRLEARLQAWFDATERYARQLHETDRDAYLKMKRNEFRRLSSPP